LLTGAGIIGALVGGDLRCPVLRPDPVASQWVFLGVC
jgi:hypothetical protein